VVGSKTLTYRDAVRTPDGIKSVQLKAGRDEEAGVTVVGKGENLGLPEVLGLAPPVVAQFQSETGQCWESVHGAAGLETNTATAFRAFGTP
jgi:hypothetical protein